MWYERKNVIYNLSRYNQIYLNSCGEMIFFDGQEFESLEFDSDIEAQTELEKIKNILGI